MEEWNKRQLSRRVCTTTTTMTIEEYVIPGYNPAIPPPDILSNVPPPNVVIANNLRVNRGLFNRPNARQIMPAAGHLDPLDLSHQAIAEPPAQNLNIPPPPQNPPVLPQALENQIRNPMIERAPMQQIAAQPLKAAEKLNIPPPPQNPPVLPQALENQIRNPMIERAPMQQIAAQPLKAAEKLNIPPTPQNPPVLPQALENQIRNPMIERAPMQQIAAEPLKVTFNVRPHQNQLDFNRPWNQEPSTRNASQHAPFPERQQFAEPPAALHWNIPPPRTLFGRNPPLTARPHNLFVPGPSPCVDQRQQIAQQIFSFPPPQNQLNSHLPRNQEPGTRIPIQHAPCPERQQFAGAAQALESTHLPSQSLASLPGDNADESTTLPTLIREPQQEIANLAANSIIQSAGERSSRSKCSSPAGVIYISDSPEASAGRISPILSPSQEHPLPLRTDMPGTSSGLLSTNRDVPWTLRSRHALTGPLPDSDDSDMSSVFEPPPKKMKKKKLALRSKHKDESGGDKQHSSQSKESNETSSSNNRDESGGDEQQNSKSSEEEAMPNTCLQEVGEPGPGDPFADDPDSGDDPGLSDDECIICFERFEAGITYVGKVAQCGHSHFCYHCVLSHVINYRKCPWCSCFAWDVKSFLFR